MAAMEEGFQDVNGDGRIYEEDLLAEADSTWGEDGYILTYVDMDFDECAEAVANVMEDFAYGDDEYDDDEDELFDEDNPDYEVKCPDCGAEIVVDEDTLLEGEINCPNCGNELEFDFTSLFADEVCDCGDPDCPMCNPE